MIVSFEESISNAGPWTPIAGPVLDPLADGQIIRTVGLVNTKRWVRATVLVIGEDSDGMIGVEVCWFAP